jgi:hypothetical protein
MNKTDGDRPTSDKLDQVGFELDDERFKQFTGLLETSPAASVGLVRLMTVQASWIQTDKRSQTGIRQSPLGASNTLSALNA